jgi:hypothetical protein
VYTQVCPPVTVLTVSKQVVKRHEGSPRSSPKESHGLSDSCSFQMLFSVEVHTCSMEARLLQQDCITPSNERLLVSGRVADENLASTSVLSNSAIGSFPVNVMYIVESSPKMSSLASRRILGNVGRQKRVEPQTRAFEPYNEEPAESQTSRSNFSSSKKLSGLISQCTTP